MRQLARFVMWVFSDCNTVYSHSRQNTDPPSPRRIVSLCGCSNWFYYPAAASTPGQASRVAAWAVLDDGSVVGLLADRGGNPPTLRMPDRSQGGAYRHWAELPVTLQQR